jgi:hypothetical protein
MSEKMPVERAAEILDPKHRERYESLSVVEEACSMGHDALLLRIPRSPYKNGFSCPNCGSSDYLYGYYDKRNKCCGNCGQAILWED